jgi:hypothetical protein
MLYKKGAYPPWEYHESFTLSFITSGSEDQLVLKERPTRQDAAAGQLR